MVGPVCGRRRPFQDSTERPAAAVVGSNGLNKHSLLPTTNQGHIDSFQYFTQAIAKLSSIIPTRVTSWDRLHDKT